MAAILIIGAGVLLLFGLTNHPNGTGPRVLVFYRWILRGGHGANAAPQGDPGPTPEDSAGGESPGTVNGPGW